MFLVSIFRKITKLKWNIGFVETSIDGIISGEELKVNWLKHDFKDRWFADPFILDVTENLIYVLVEEYYYPIKRGRIAKLSISRKDYHLLKSETILELDTHLSFPAIIRKNSNIYIYPENSASGKLYLYEYNVNTNKCTKLQSLCDEPLTDAIYTEIFGKPLIYSTAYPLQNGSKLGIYEGQSFFSIFRKEKEYIFSENIARNAGDFFEHKGKIYRPAQECNVNYGHGISLQEVNIADGKIEFKEIRRMTSPHPQMKVAFHTMNIYKGMTVVDCQGYKNGFLGNVVRSMRNLLIKTEQ